MATVAQAIDRRRVRRELDTSRANDVTKLSFPLQLVILIVSAFLAASGAIWANQSHNNVEFAKIGSDVRDIITRLDAERRVGDANARLLELNNATMNKAIEANAKTLSDSLSAITKRQEMQQLQIVELKESIVVLTTQRRQ